VLPGAVWDIGQEGRGTGHKGLYHGIIQSLVSQLYRCRCCRRWTSAAADAVVSAAIVVAAAAAITVAISCTLPLLSDAHQHAPYSVTPRPHAGPIPAPPREPHRLAHQCLPERSVSLSIACNSHRARVNRLVTCCAPLLNVTGGWTLHIRRLFGRQRNLTRAQELVDRRLQTSCKDTPIRAH
jgi:hypothetical protein